MKKLLISVSVIVVALVSFHFVSDHYRYEFYDWAIDFEASKSGLVSKSAQIGPLRFAYLEGPEEAGLESIIMLHGFGASKENWLRFAGYLSDQYHVVAVDLLGHGANKRDLAQSYTVESQVEYLHQVAKVLGIEKFHLVGNSMGGAISSLYAATYPKQVHTITLISPAGVHDIPSKMDELLEKGTNPLIALNVDDFKYLLDFVMEKPPFIPAAITKVEAEKAASRIDINQKIFKDLRSDLEKGMEGQLKNIQAPALLIWGDQDRAINVANIDKYAQLIPKATKLVMPGIGHLAMIEVPEESAEATIEFLQSSK